METPVQTTWPSQMVLGAWEQQDVFYPLQAVDGNRLNDCGSQHNDTGAHAPGWINPDETFDRIINDCNSRYPTAAKSNGKIGEAKKWKDCKGTAAKRREEIIATNAKLEAKAASDESINKTIAQISGPDASSTSSAGGIDASTITYVGGGIMLLLILFFGWKWYQNRQVAQVAPPIA